MSRSISQALNYIDQDVIANLNDMIGSGKFIMYLEMLKKLEDIIMSDYNGCFADDAGEPLPGVFQMLRTLRMLKDDIRALNAFCPSYLKEDNDDDSDEE